MSETLGVLGSFLCSQAVVPKRQLAVVSNVAMPAGRGSWHMLGARVLKTGEIVDGGVPPTYETMHWQFELGITPLTATTDNRQLIPAQGLLQPFQRLGSGGHFAF
jgi:hypothetical protein